MRWRFESSTTHPTTHSPPLAGFFICGGRAALTNTQEEPLNTKSPDKRGRRGRYRVVAVRSLRRSEVGPMGRRTEEREVDTFELGPFRWRVSAWLVAWLESYRSGGWIQRCTVEKIEGGS